MGDRKRVSRRFWPTHIYDYNYKVSEGYYSPQKQYMDASPFERHIYAPPKHSSYAERFASDPWYGKARGCPHKTGDVVLDSLTSKPPEVRSRPSILLNERKKDNDIDFLSRPSRLRRRSELEDEIGSRPQLARNLSYDSSAKPRLHPRFKDVGEKLRSLDAELLRLAPRRSSVTDDPYSSSYGTSSVHQSSRTDVSSYDSTKPPASPRVRKISFNEDFAQPPPRPPRGRISSLGDLPNLPRSRRSSITSDDDDVRQYSTRAGKLRDERRLKESREITEGINNMIEKMRANKLTVEAGYFDREEKGIRKSKIDPKLREDQKTNPNFVYGSSRKY